VKAALRHPALHWALGIGLGGVFVYASLDKIAQPAEFAKIIYHYRILGPDFDTGPLMANLLAVTLPWLELVAGLLLYVRMRRLGEGGRRTGYCDPELMPAVGERLAAAGFAIDTAYERSRFDDYGFGITRAAGAIAETGTVILSDEETSDRLGALTPWVHVAVLDPGRLVRTVGDALSVLGDSVNTIWATGPSKTADVEGILIEGVHGPGEQICLRLE